MTSLESHFIDLQNRQDASFAAEECRIATTANDESDDVYVTLPNSDSPAERVLVSYWRVQVGIAGGGALEPRWPERGNRGLAVYMDTGEIWLIY